MEGPEYGEELGLKPRRFSVAEYYRMAETGVLKPRERVELLEGLVVLRSPSGRPHAVFLSRLNGRLAQALPLSRFALRVQLPLSLSDDSEPEPNIAVVTREMEDRAPLHPPSALLVVEAATSSLRKDRLVKARLYARAGIAEYCIANLSRRTLEVYSSPDIAAGVYREVRTLDASELWRPLALPPLDVPLPDLFVQG